MTNDQDHIQPQDPSDSQSPETLAEEGTQMATADKRPISTNKMLIGIGVVLVIVAIAAFILISPGQQTYSVHGSLEASSCGGGYDLAHTGVKVTDEKNVIVGSTTTSGNTSISDCVVTFRSPFRRQSFTNSRSAHMTAPPTPSRSYKIRTGVSR